MVDRGRSGTRAGAGSGASPARPRASRRTWPRAVRIEDAHCMASAPRVDASERRVGRHSRAAARDARPRRALGAHGQRNRDRSPAAGAGPARGRLDGSQRAAPGHDSRRDDSAGEPPLQIARGQGWQRPMIRVLVIDDHGLVRQGIRQFLADTPDIIVGADASNAADGLARARREQWGAVLLDLTLPDSHGLDVLKELRREQPDVPILVLSMHPEDQFALRAIRAGASGYLTKNSAPEELVTAIRAVVSGRHYLSPWLAERLAREATGHPFNAAHEQLSDRE